MRKLISVNPANGEIVGESEVSSEKDIQAAVKKSNNTFTGWRQTPFKKRADYARKFSKILKRNQEEIARLTSLEMGKPIREARDDVTFELEFIDWYADNAEKILGEKIIRE